MVKKKFPNNVPHKVLLVTSKKRSLRYMNNFLCLYHDLCLSIPLDKHSKLSPQSVACLFRVEEKEVQLQTTLMQVTRENTLKKF